MRRRKRSEAQVSEVPYYYFQTSIPRQEKASAVVADDAASVQTDVVADSGMVDDDAPSWPHFVERHL